ncbi:MAG: SOS response-associated peptidase family protein [Xanthobacteraceae bacterium]
MSCRLTAPAAIPNLQPIYNVCPTDPVDTVVANDGKRELVEMRWGLVPSGGRSHSRNYGWRHSMLA